MSSTVQTMKSESPPPPSSNWSLWRHQIAAILRLDLEKNFFGKRSILVYLLASMPVGLLIMVEIVNPLGRDLSQYQNIFAFIYSGLILRTVIFFGCAWIFMNLFRGEIVDRSLHYYFLSAVRRDVLVAGKYISGLLTSIVLFTGTTVISLLLLYLPHFYSESLRFFTEGAGFGQLLTYAGITILACIGYGAFFLLIGLFFRNPIIPALLLYGWEWLNFLLPPFLKKISVIHYLTSLAPVPIPQGPFSIVAEPTAAVFAVPGLLGVTVLVLIIAAYRIRHMEIRYGSD